METKQKQEKPWFIERYNEIKRYKDIHFDELYEYDYHQQIVLDIYDYCLDNAYRVLAKLIAGYTPDEIEDELFDLCFIDDSVTGNDSGSYWFNNWYAEKALCHNFYTLVEALDDLGEAKSFNLIESNPETLDVYIRCYLLRECVYEYVHEIIRYYVED